MSARAEMSAAGAPMGRGGRWRSSCTRTVFGRLAAMTRFPLVLLMALGLLGGATQAPAACRRFGTQLECALGARQLVIGTQAAREPAYARTLRPQLLQGGDGVLDDRPPHRWPLRLEIQNVCEYPSLCRMICIAAYCT